MTDERETETSHEGGVTSRGREWLRPHLGIDSRALAAFRISLGLVLLADLLAIRGPGLATFYTDAGLLPRSLHAELFPTFASLSLHAVSGALWAQGLLLALAALAALCLLVGYRTRVATAISVVLHASLFLRNPYVLNGGDTILLTFLFFGCFLPLGRRWSVDARLTPVERVDAGRDGHGVTQTDSGSGTDERPRNEDRDPRVLSVGTATIIGYFLLVYLTNAAFKFQSEAWLSGEAVPRIFQLEAFTVFLGPVLAEHTGLLVAINWAWTALLVASVLLVVDRDWIRLPLVAALAGAHLSMAATMRLGLFPWIMIAGLLLFVPPRVWNAVETGAATAGLGRRLAIAVDRRSGLLSRLHSTALARRLPSVVARVTRVLTAVLLIALLGSLAVWQAAGAGLVDSPVPEAADVTPADYSLAMFAPNPPDSDSWFVAEARLASGDEVDLFRDGDEVAWEPPPDAAETYPTVLWHRHLSEIRYADERQYEPVAAYLCATADRDVESVSIHYVDQPVGPEGPTGDPTTHHRIDYEC